MSCFPLQGIKGGTVLPERGRQGARLRNTSKVRDDSWPRNLILWESKGQATDRPDGFLRKSVCRHRISSDNWDQYHPN